MDNSNFRIITSAKGKWDPPRYIAYDYICKKCPQGDQGDRLIFYANHPLVAKPDDELPLTYQRFYFDHRYQVYSINQENMPPQFSIAGIHSFWCIHDLELADKIQQDFYNHGLGTVVGNMAQAETFSILQNTPLIPFGADTPQTSNVSGNFQDITPPVGPATSIPNYRGNYSFKRGMGYRARGYNGRYRDQDDKA